MASIALDSAYRRISVEEFLEMDFGGARAELEDGLIYMMAGGNEAHARVAGNVLTQLRIALRGSGCRPYGPDFATRTADRTVRLPDVSVYCNNPGAPGNEGKQLLGDPQIVIEVLSPSTMSYDQSVKLEEYRRLAGVREIVLIDPIKQQVRLVQREGEGGWSDRWLKAGSDLALPSVAITIPHAEIFARD
ncbi:Uma2 family endonuclease [Sphingomonas sp. PB4P5]|uniref:Uma2 family endonuclease n=1 Tax=Parasphingomonas puruogangriensis TaxID=3096155 RepID=UPI002FCC3488